MVNSVNGLPPELRALVILRYREKFSYDDIASRLSVSAEGVSSRLCQAILRLHARFGMMMGDGPEVLGEPAMLSADCRIVERFVPQYVDGAVSAVHRPGIEEHLHSCAACREKVARFRSVRAMLETAYASAPSRAVVHDIFPGGTSSTVVSPLAGEPATLVDPLAAVAELQKIFSSPQPLQPLLTEIRDDETRLPAPLTPMIPDACAHETICLAPLATTGTLKPIAVSHSTVLAPAPVEILPVRPAPAPVVVREERPIAAIPIPVATVAAKAQSSRRMPAASRPVLAASQALAVEHRAAFAAAVAHPTLGAQVDAAIQQFRDRMAQLRRALATVPFWFISCAFHVLVIALVGLISMTIQMPQEEITVVSTELYHPPQPKLEVPPPTREQTLNALVDSEKTGDEWQTGPALSTVTVAPDSDHLAEIGSHFETRTPELADDGGANGSADAHQFDPSRHDTGAAGGGGNDGDGLNSAEAVAFGSAGVMDAKRIQARMPKLADDESSVNPDVRRANTARRVIGTGSGPETDAASGPSVQDTITFGSGGSLGKGGVASGSKGKGGGFGGGKGGGAGSDTGPGAGGFGQRSDGGRKTMIEKHGGSPATENAVAKALQWLASQQAADGHWGEAHKEPVLFLTSISTLAFLGAGHSEKSGLYKDNVTRAVNWLRHIPEGGVRTAVANGYDRNGGYSLAVMTLALSEAAGMGNVAETREAAQRAVTYCTDVYQNGSGSQKGGWRYGPKEKGDLSVTGWFVMALKSAKVAGLHVDPDAFTGADHFIDSVQYKATDPEINTRYDPAYGPVYGFGYMPLNPVIPASAQPRVLVGTDCCHVIGNLCRLFMGHKLEEVRPSIDYSVRKFGVPERGKENLYYWYYGSLCTFQSGGESWKEWNAGMQNTLLPSQNLTGDNAGSWEPLGEYSQSWGRTGQTALSALCLEVYYRYAKLGIDK